MRSKLAAENRHAFGADRCGFRRYRRRRVGGGGRLPVGRVGHGGLAVACAALARKDGSRTRRRGRCGYARCVAVPSRDAILAALEHVIDPELKRPVTELDMVRSVDGDGSHVAVTIALTVAGCPLRHSFEQQVQEALLPLDGVETVSLAFDVMSPDEKSALVTRLRGGVERRGISLDPRTRVIAVASGKGGVGKSSLTANLAGAFEALGEQVGILDADVYGHSIPHMLGVHQRPIVVEKMIVPPVRGDL